ncbi:hypothetical protein KSC_002650 [Ktedonobacter sp. SOSP1-52]|uniref:hypothetical protein n=1 Tax=Ktedonobacter sp. SOSP1-52 TaxID=2778366 RepID=UPI00191504AC|nr:hypothetical protein [Ktedonobacter sp. SOSP1-52]GHO61373.1 hypothetical protein KSC_002650 [Ktedonobacter sp. SOSP1-52]
MLLAELGRCPIGDGEALLETVLSKASEKQIVDLQEAPDAHKEQRLRELLVTLESPPPSREAERMLGRVLFKGIEVKEGQTINPALILKELFALQSSLESRVPGTLHRQATILRAVLNPDPSRQPAIAALRAVLGAGSVAKDEPDHELALQLLDLYNRACDDGCPVCLSADSDIEHHYLAPLLNSRRALKGLRGVLLEGTSGSCVSEVKGPLMEGRSARVQAEPGNLGDQLNPTIGLGIVQEIDDAGQASDTSAFVVDFDAAADFLVDGKWQPRWGDPKDMPYKTPKGRRVRTSDERIIASALEGAGIPFDYEPALAYEDDEERIHHIHPTFHLFRHELYLQYWGPNDALYIESRQHKEQVYMRPDVQRRARVLFLEPEDLENGTFMEKIEARIRDDRME